MASDLERLREVLEAIPQGDVLVGSQEWAPVRAGIEVLMTLWPQLLAVAEAAVEQYGEWSAVGPELEELRAAIRAHLGEEADGGE